MSSSNAPVIVGVSEGQPAVVRYGVQEAVRLETSLRVVHCSTDQAGPPHAGGGLNVVTRAAGAAILQQAKAVVEALPVAVVADYLLEHGDPGSLLIEQSEDASALVVGAGDVSWGERMLGGDVSGRVVLGASCPVTVVPRQLASDASLSGVVVTLDGDTSTAGPLRYGFEQAEFRVEELHVMHATPAATTDDDTAVITARVLQEVERWNALLPDVHAQLSLTNGDSLEECIKAAKGASLLVIGRPHGHGQMFALTRPVAMLVLRDARCAVAIVPARYGSLPRPRSA